MIANLNISGQGSGKKGAFTSRSEFEQKSYTVGMKAGQGQTRFSFAADKDRAMSEVDGANTTNKKKQDLSDQLRQISQKIDKEIIELRKQNNEAKAVQAPKTKRDHEVGRLSVTTRAKADSAIVVPTRKDDI